MLVIKIVVLYRCWGRVQLSTAVIGNEHTVTSQVGSNFRIGGIQNTFHYYRQFRNTVINNVFVQIFVLQNKLQRQKPFQPFNVVPIQFIIKKAHYILRQTRAFYLVHFCHFFRKISQSKT